MAEADVLDGDSIFAPKIITKNADCRILSIIDCTVQKILRAMIKLVFF